MRRRRFALFGHRRVSTLAPATVAVMPRTSDAPTIEELLSEGYELQGWKALEKHEWQSAHETFTKSIEHVGTNVRRHGRALIGKAWAAYWTALEESAPTEYSP